MKKFKIQNILLYIINFILISFIVFSNKNMILNNNTMILKNMDETIEVENLNKSIETLNASHTEYSNYIQTSKQKITNAINMYPNNNASEENTLEELSTMINNLTIIPENTYFYEKGTEGDSSTIKRYKKIGEDYFSCDVNGIVLDNTSSTDVTSLTLVPYSYSTAENLSAGSASFVDKSIILGNSFDNSSYLEKNKIVKTMSGKGQTWLNNFNGDYLSLDVDPTDIIVIASVSCNSNATPSNSISTDGIINSYCSNKTIYQSGSWNSSKGIAKLSFANITGATYVKVKAYSYGTDGICIAAYCII